jgi:hypothetical protein
MFAAMSEAIQEGSRQNTRRFGVVSARKTNRVGAYSRYIGLGQIDGRLREAKALREITAELTAYVGGHPSAIQRRLIERAAKLHLRLLLMDEQTGPGAMSEKNGREYICWHSAYTRTLKQLGPDKSAVLPPLIQTRSSKPSWKNGASVRQANSHDRAAHPRCHGCARASRQPISRPIVGCVALRS